MASGSVPRGRGVGVFSAVGQVAQGRQEGARLGCPQLCGKCMCAKKAHDGVSPSGQLARGVRVGWGVRNRTSGP